MSQKAAASRLAIDPEHIEPVGDLEFPVAPGRAFARLFPEKLPEEMQSQGIGAAVPDGAFFRYRHEDSSLVAETHGLAVIEGSGLSFAPIWRLSKDATELNLDAYPHDHMGDDLNARKIAEDIAKIISHPGLDYETIEQALLQSKTQGRVLKDVLLAKGKPPRHGEDGKLRMIAGKTASSGAVRENGNIDYRERESHTSVQEGEILAELSEPGKGVPGTDIFGAEIPARDGKPVRFKAGKDVESASDENGTTVFTASVPGLLVVGKGSISITRVIEIDADVNIGTGNVHADEGSVLVKGTVTSGSFVSAKEDVIVKAVVENANISAGRDLFVSGGIIMEKDALIEAGGDVHAKFLRNATIRAGGDVVVKVDIVNSDIQAGGKVIAASERGSISGGSITCGAGLETLTIGNENAVPTAICLQPPDEDPAVERKKRALQERLAQMDRLIGSDDTTNTLLLAPEEDRLLLQELFKLRSKLLQKIQELDAEMQSAMDDIGDRLGNLRIQARKTIHPGTTIYMANKQLTLNKAVSASKAIWDKENGAIALVGL